MSNLDCCTIVKINHQITLVSDKFAFTYIITKEGKLKLESKI